MYKIFIADDEAIIREGIKCLLDYESLGFTITGEASNGKTAYQGILEQMPDVVFLDIRMPEMSGLEVIRKLKVNGFNGRLIILSGYSDFKYAQEAIRYGVEYYLTKPIDEEELEEILYNIKGQLDETLATENTREHYRRKAKDAILCDILSGTADFSSFDPEELLLQADIYQVIIYETYNRNASGINYRFSDLLRVVNQDNNSYDSITYAGQEVVLLKGSFAIQKFNEFLERYQQEKRPQKASPLDSLFIAYGKLVSSISEIKDSYHQAAELSRRRFFCDQGQHTIGYMELPGEQNLPFLLNDSLRDSYAEKLFGYLQAFNRNRIAKTLHKLQSELYNTADSIPEIRLFLTDLFLQIKERINHLYSGANIPFPNNAQIIKSIEECLYLYEIILYLTELFELVISSIGNTSRESVLDDILHYINHNYAGNITLENIAPLFGYNSSYLGKLFSKKMGENFNSYIDHVRIEHSKELLLSSDMKVYAVAEKVGYRNVDYFHVKFKKYMGKSPAEYRRENRGGV
ncbi:MAG: response regulator [Roseburia sp.]|nr:response regulator [Roseburia sp.]